MPRYTYICDECNTSVELLSSIAERDGVKLCDLCNNELRRGFDRPGMVSKTGGGYAL